MPYSLQGYGEDSPIDLSYCAQPGRACKVYVPEIGGDVRSSRPDWAPSRCAMEKFERKEKAEGRLAD